ncbi:hypothetical protein IIA_05830 [Bacillus cereus VD014]|uniref:RNA polymerase sigma-70 region 4 domain-containing protein n=2 Tax=Bacillus cereus TaxID=1396 RepID=A0A9W5K1T5_BACC8|nr:hypothetical protein IIA_05830 [Bacillus cereus VD014]
MDNGTMQSGWWGLLAMHGSLLQQRDIPLALDEIAGRHDRIMAKSERLKQRIADKKTLLGEAQFIMSKKKGLEQQIIYLRDIMGFNLKQVASELGYSYDHIRRVSSRMKRSHNYATTQTH